jgi:hypothetical protein
MRVVREPYHALEGSMLVRLKINGPEFLLKHMRPLMKILQRCTRNCR